MASVITPIGILSFPHLFVPKPRAPGAEAVYSCTLIFDLNAQRDPQWLALRRAVMEEIDNKNGIGKSKDPKFMTGLRSPFRKCDEKEYSGYDIEGGYFISAWSKSRPGIVDARRNEISVPDDVWAGQAARISVTPFYYNVSGNRGVSFMLNNIQICRVDGPRLDGRRQARDEFDDFDDGTGGAVPANDDDVVF